MKKVEAVLSDLDGTLVAPDKTISIANHEALAALRSNGIHFVPVTGRDYTDIAPVLIEHGVKGPGVYSGGSAIVDTENGTSLWTEKVSRDVSRRVVAQACEFAERIGYGLGRMAVQNIDVASIEHDPVSIWVEYAAARHAEAAGIRDRFPELSFHQSVHRDSNLLGLHITPAGINKQTAANHLLDMLNVLPQNTIAIGDDLNDIPLFSVSPITVAMGNAHSELKRIATHTTASCKEDGFATAIQMLVLED